MDPDSELPPLDEMDRQLLLAIAFLPTFSVGDADYLIGVKGAGDRLLALRDRVQWLSAYGRERYTIDPDIRTQLLAAAQTEWPPERIRGHKRHVAAILEQRREFGLSLSLFVDAKDEEGANRVLGRLGTQWFLRRDPAEFLDLARRLEQFSRLGIEGHLACALVADAEGDYERSFRQCRGALQSDLDDDSRRTFLVLQARAQARQREGLQEEGTPFEAVEESIAGTESSVMNSYLAAEQVRRGAFKAADHRLRSSLSGVEGPPSEYALGLAALRRADLQLRMGRYQTALASLRKIFPLDSVKTTWLAMRRSYLLAEVLGFRGEFTDAASSAATALDLAAYFAFDLPRQRALVLLSDLAVWMGDLDQARTWFGEAESIIHPSLQTEDARQVFATTRGRLAWAAGAIDEAREAFRIVRRIHSDDCFARLWNHLAACHAQLRIEGDERPLVELERIVSEAERIDALHIQANALLLAAYSMMQEDDSKTPGDSLARFWDLVDLHGFRFMPASDPEIVLWAQRSRAEYYPGGTARTGRLIAPPLLTATAAGQGVVQIGAMRPLVEIDTFGPLTIRVRGEKHDDIWKSRLKAKRFLEILLSSDGQRTTADEAAEYLWPAASPDRIRHSLHNEVSNLRKIFTALDVHGHIEVRYEHTFYRLYCSDQVRVTHSVFQSLAERARAKSDEGETATASKLFREAVEYYTGMFLKDAQYERFADTVRQHLADLYAECLRTLAEAPDSDDTEALNWWQKAIEHDPFDEDAYRSAIDISLRMGQKGRALKHLSMLEERLVRELELPLPTWAEDVAEKLKES